LLEIIFEIPINLEETMGLLIVHESFLGLYFALLLFLMRDKGWKGLMAIHIKEFCKSVKGSYWNYSILKAVSGIHLKL
jgi:hypothetical protein